MMNEQPSTFYLPESPTYTIGGAEFGDIRYTEPLLNNLHIAEPTLHLLEHHAEKTVADDTEHYHDPEGNVILSLPL